MTDAARIERLAVDVLAELAPELAKPLEQYPACAALLAHLARTLPTTAGA